MSGTIVTGTPGSGGLPEAAAKAACERCGPAGAPTALVIELDRTRPRNATVIATAAAKDLERRLREADGMPEGATARARGRIVFAALPDGSPESVGAVLDLVPDEVPRVIVAPPARFRGVLDLDRSWEEVLIRTDRDPGPEPDFGSDPDPGSNPDARSSLDPEPYHEPEPYFDPESSRDPLLLLATAEIESTGVRVQVVPKALGRLRGRLALAGRLTGPTSAAAAAPASAPVRARGRGDEPDGIPEWAGEPVRAGERGQATPLALGGVLALVLGTVALVAIGGAITGKARGQRAADLSALSAARSMKDDLPRLMAPPTLPGGAPNPYHLPKPAYLARAARAATRTAKANGASPLRVSVRFPDRASWAPVRARVSIGVAVEGTSGRGSRRSTPVWAEARVSAPVSMGAVPSMATGGGYSGPLAERQGKGMRPDVAAAFDAMSAAASAAGVTLVINSAFRSDAEQAALFAANPNPTMVARPGTSLHRCGTELDLGPPSAYGWLAANATRFGFVQRYSWESWHYGYTRGPAPCSAAGDRVGGSGPAHRGDRSQAPPASLPSFVPARFRQPILRAAMRWNVSAALLATQLQAESGFDPSVVSSAGAMGIAQFMPGTAATYGLRDPFDPEAAIEAQAHLMSDLLQQFGSPALALAAYNAGPGAVAPCRCVPDYPETQAYVAKILALLGGIGAIAPTPMEIELVK